MQKEIPTIYDQSKESELYKLWESSGYFNPDNLDGKPFTIMMPPPNANAPLHVGHALGMTVQDILIRFNRMQRKKTLWLPGTDHAGFETQVVFEKKLEKEGKSRFQMTREEFYQACWEFVQANKHISEEGMRRLGASCDWSRNIFTLDPQIVKIVYTTFEQMYKDGLVYRAGRICNWCAKHQTGLADLETKYEARTEPFYYFKYGPFIIGTSRPETKFGDKYVVMHPKDKRYLKYKAGETIQLEWINGPVTATIIKDEAVDMSFGTGVMTITPAHDAVDFEIAQRHSLDIEQVIDKRGKLLPIAGEFAGMKILEARPKIVEKLKTKGLLDKIEENYQHNVQLCYKCGNLIEPQIVPQWYVKMTEKLKDGRPSLRDMAVRAVKSGEVKIVTKRFERIFLNWMKELRDWPISRQIWWGIAIPAWYCGGIEKVPQKKMGWEHTIVPELSKGKTRTYRLRDHGLQIGDQVAFEDSGPQILLGHATITGIKKTTVGEIGLPDQLHSGKYKTTPELIQAFKRIHPETEVTGKTAAMIYDFKFTPFSGPDCGQTIISEKKPDKCPACGGTNIIQDPDTFDTWFSSGQWPYASMMANDAKHKTGDLDRFFPSDIMETGWDIIFFWVARMVMLSYYRFDKPPFKHVYLHGLVRDKDKQKMSKSKGNVMDPLGIIDQYGVDALRMALTVGVLPGVDSTISEDKIRGYRNFANKIWNASRFVLQNSYDLPSSVIPAKAGIQTLGSYTSPAARGRSPIRSGMTTEDKKIIAELETVTKEVTKLLDKYDFAHAADLLYHYFWHTFADKIIEDSKAKLGSPETRASAQLMLKTVLETCLKLLHPFMPFVTEAVWQINHKDLLMIQPWPTKTTKKSSG